MTTISSRVRRYHDVLQLLRAHGGSDLASLDEIDLRLDGVGDGIEAGSDPEEFASDLEALGPTYVKLGQMLAARPDLLPDGHIRALRRLQDHVEPADPEAIRQVLADELGSRASHLRGLEPAPHAAGSLAQVHRAELPNGQAVAVKIQRPDIVEVIRTDLAVLGELSTVLDATETGRVVGFGQLVEQFRSTLLDELDFTREAQNVLTYGNHLRDAERLRVPRIVEELSTRRVLVMEWIDGRPMAEVEPGDVHDGPELARELLEHTLDQILLHGLVHADPHPGNVLYTPSGDLAIIDLGAVTRLGSRARRQLLRMMLAVAEQDSEAVVRIAADLGTPLEDFDADGFEQDVASLISAYGDRSSGSMQAGRLFVELARACMASHLRPPPGLTMVGRALLDLDDVVGRIDPDHAIAETVEAHLQDVVVEAAEQHGSPTRLARTALDTASFVERLPGQATRLLDQLAAGDLTVKVDAIDEQDLMRSLEKLTNRLVVGLVLASVVIGAALSMRVDTDTTLLGYPAVSVIFFALAAILGLGFVVQMLVVDRRDRMRRRR